MADFRCIDCKNILEQELEQELKYLNEKDIYKPLFEKKPKIAEAELERISIDYRSEKRSIYKCFDYEAIEYVDATNLKCRKCGSDYSFLNYHDAYDALPLKAKWIILNRSQRFKMVNQDYLESLSSEELQDLLDSGEIIYENDEFYWGKKPIDRVKEKMPAPDVFIKFSLHENYAPDINSLGWLDAQCNLFNSNTDQAAKLFVKLSKNWPYFDKETQENLISFFKNNDTRENDNLEKFLEGYYFAYYLPISICLSTFGFKLSLIMTFLLEAVRDALKHFDISNGRDFECSTLVEISNSIGYSIEKMRKRKYRSIYGFVTMPQFYYGYLTCRGLNNFLIKEKRLPNEKEFYKITGEKDSSRFDAMRMLLNCRPYVLSLSDYMYEILKNEECTFVFDKNKEYPFKIVSKYTVEIFGEEMTFFQLFKNIAKPCREFSYLFDINYSICHLGIPLIELEPQMD